MTDTAERLAKALEDIVNPLGKMRREAEEQGFKLNGNAYEIANSLTYVQMIARDALAAYHKEHPNG